MDIYERIVLIINEKNFSLSGFEKEMGWSNGSFRKAIENKASLGIDRIAEFSKKFSDINIHWLFTGQGDKLNSSSERTSFVVSEEQSGYVLEFGYYKKIYPNLRNQIKELNKALTSVSKTKDILLEQIDLMDLELR